MTFRFLFWIIMLLWLLAILGAHFALIGFGPLASTVLLFVLLGLLGWKIFGPPLTP